MKKILLPLFVLVFLNTSFADEKPKCEFSWSCGPAVKSEKFSEPYGDELALKVMEKLKQGKYLINRHREYCGTGLGYKDGTYYYAECFDGDFTLSIKVVDGDYPFHYWFSRQSDESLSRSDLSDHFFRYNQTITRDRIEEFLK